MEMEQPVSAEFINARHMYTSCRFLCFQSTLRYSCSVGTNQVMGC